MVGLLSLSKSTFTVLGEKSTTAYLWALKDDGDPDKENQFVFQYFPDAISDTKQVNWSPREVPGGSLPLYQWVSSGERTISFTAYFATDVNLTDPLNSGVASRLESQGLTRRNIDIRSALIKLRQFTLPSYDPPTQVGTPIAKAPPKVLLVLPGSGIGMLGGMLEEMMFAIMTQCDITYEAFFPNGAPRIASVALSFAQVAQQGATITFPSRTENVKSAVKGSWTWFKYTIEARDGERLTP